MAQDYNSLMTLDNSCLCLVKCGVSSKLLHNLIYYTEVMWTRRTLVTLLLLILPSLSDSVKTTCEIPSVEAGDNATLTIHFSEDLTNARLWGFSIMHLSHIEKEMLSCVFSNGKVKCNNVSCCTWENHVTDVFRVYIHNASQQLEGTFWGFLLPAEVSDQKYCTFTLKASSCSKTSINATNSHVTCTNQPVAIGQTCTVICNFGHYIQENQTSVTYMCVGKNKWSPEIPVKSCEAITCPRDFINATNSRVICSDQSVTIVQKCTVICNTDHYFQENLTSVTYTCIGKNKWSPDIPAIFCEEHSKVLKDLKAEKLHFLFPLSITLFSLTVVVIMLFICHKVKKRRKNKEDPLLPLKSKELQLRDQASQQSAEYYWLECIRTWYPELQSRTYFLPPFHFHHVPYDVRIVAGNKDSNVRDDSSLERVLQCLRALADDPLQKEVMMVVSQLQFGKYLGKPSYAAAAALLPRPSKIPEEFLRHHYDNGDCDVLIIHGKLGLLTLEIRSVGGNFSQQKMTEQQQDEVVMKEVKRAVEQLNRAEVVLKHLTSDCTTTIHITKILVLPNIKSSQLLRAINGTHDGQYLCQCFSVQNVDDAVKLCLLSDQFSDNHMSSDRNHSSHQAFAEWWKHIVMMSGPQNLMTTSLYELLVARFCGPATTVEVHCVTAPRLNIGEGMSETGERVERVSRLVLFPQQVDILNQSPPRAFLSGPPGTGKTIVLIMQGLTWLQRGHDAHVVSTCDESRAVTIVIEHQLQETAKKSTTRSRVHRHQFEFEKDGEVKTAVKRLKSLSEGRQLCVIVDEAMRFYRKSFTEFCDQLIVQEPRVFIWGASMHHDVGPLCLKEVKLTTPLRSPPVVVREVMKSRQIMNKEVCYYTVSDIPVPTDGPPVMRLQHLEGQSGHTEFWPHDCVECGHEVARVLTKLDVGQTGDHNGPPPLQYRDILVLCHEYPTDDRVDSNVKMSTMARGLAWGLSDCNVPVRVVKEGDEAAIRDTALGVSDMVTVANWRDVQGLERKVVVVERGIGEYGRLYAMSRCTAQLVVIDCWCVSCFHYDDDCINMENNKIPI